MEIGELRAALMEVADPAKAKQMADYMKDHFPFLGVTAGDRRTVAKPITNAAKKMAPDELLELVTSMWAEPEREFHYAGMDALRAGAKHLRLEDLSVVRGFIEATPWWDTVDGLAVHSVGVMVANHQGLVHEMDDWIESNDIWIARTAIIHQLMFKERTDANRLFTYCEMSMEHTDFFIRKAIGWALRQYARTDAEAVVAFVKHHEGTLSGLSKREALKHL
ncbi:MAG: 3-methyladenine DNA glycosylase AlkD [Verrucomicrobiales bacterium]|jgi:3-methyladenine DNA glycosylase AlkD